MNINQQLNKVLEFLIAHKDRHNINSNAIHQTIFSESISYEQAELIHRRILDSGKVKVVGGKYLGYSLESELFLQEGGFGGEYKQTANVGTKTENNPTGIKMAEIFISYAWGVPDHETNILAFTNFLREEGFDAELDKVISQRETAINFKKMMLKGMQYPKVIVVLCEDYKTRADTFAGGVGNEYSLLINDIDQNPNKYILVSFDGRSKNIIPFGLQGYDVVDMSRPDGRENLLRKLTGQHKYVLADVAPEKPKFEAVPIPKFDINPTNIISIEKPTVRVDGSTSFAGYYNNVDFDVTLGFKNISGKTIDGFGYQIRLKKELLPELYGNPVHDGYLLLDYEIPKKSFPNQPVSGEKLKLKVTSHAIHKILGTMITITVFTDYGSHSSEFAVEDLLKLHSANQTYGDLQPLNAALFA